jgi:hypothetical protein
VTLLVGLSPRRVLVYALILGNIFGRKIRWLISSSLSGFHTLAIPKHVFVLWLAMQNRLSTGDHLASWGFKGNGMENLEHLFF